MGENARPGVLPQHKEHEDEDQAQEVNIEPEDTFVSIVALKNCSGAEGHGNTLEIIGCATGHAIV